MAKKRTKRQAKETARKRPKDIVESLIWEGKVPGNNIQPPRYDFTYRHVVNEGLDDRLVQRGFDVTGGQTCEEVAKEHAKWLPKGRDYGSPTPNRCKVEFTIRNGMAIVGHRIRVGSGSVEFIPNCPDKLVLLSDGVDSLSICLERPAPISRGTRAAPPRRPRARSAR